MPLRFDWSASWGVRLESPHTRGLSGVLMESRGSNQHSLRPTCQHLLVTVSRHVNVRLLLHIDLDRIGISLGEVPRGTLVPTLLVQSLEVELFISRQSFAIPIIFDVNRRPTLLGFPGRLRPFLLLGVTDVLLLNDLIIEAGVIPLIDVIVFNLSWPGLIILVEGGMLQAVF